MARILVVDDDPHVSRTLLGLLALHQYPAQRAESGEEALELLAREPFDLVILDVRLPGMNGFETCVRIRERLGPSLPVLMLTALGDAGSLRRGYEAGADDFLQKPPDVPALILKVRAFLRLKSLHDEMELAREEAQARARDLALLHEIGRDWSLIDEPEEFNRMVIQRLAALIGAPICLIALFDPVTRVMALSPPAHGLPDELARRARYVVKPEYRSLWNFRTGRPYLSNRARSDPRLLPEMVEMVGAESVVLVPMLAEGDVLGLLVAANKPGGFSEADVQLLSIFAGPAATFIRSRQIFGHQRVHATRLERLAALVGEMSATVGRAPLIELATSGIQARLGYDRVAFWSSDDDGVLRRELEAGVPAEAPDKPADRELILWAQRGGRPLQAALETDGAALAVPVAAGDRALGVLEVVRARGGPFVQEDLSLLSAAAGQLAVALQRSESLAEAERLASQMATLYDVALETSPLRDLRVLFVKAAQEAGRLIKCDHTSVMRLDEEDGSLRLFAAWTRDPSREAYAAPVFRPGEGVAGRVAREGRPVMVNEPQDDPDFIARASPIARLLCVPLTYYDRERPDPVLFGVLNATRNPGAPPFVAQDLEYLTRFAGQLSIAVANSSAYAAERQRSQELELVNGLLREIAGSLSRDRILETAVRRIHEAFRYPVVTIGVPDPESGTFHIAAAVSRDPPPEGWGRYPIHAGVSGRAIREKRTMLVPDVSQDPDYIRLFASTRSEAAIPIRSGEEVVAVLNVESDLRRAFDRGQLITLETLADGIGVVLRNAELFHALERTNARLVELDRLKSELVNVVAHDFRTPLSGVLGHAELLEWRPDAPRDQRVEQARAIVHSATHMANLVDKTLKTSRLETGHFPFEFGLVDLAVVVRSVAERCPADDRHPLALELPEEPIPVWADRDRVAEVLENLLSNAVKYSPEGGEVRLLLRRQGESAIVSVVDRGLGIEAKDLERLFRPFSRVRNRRTADIQGSGLGLYICERIVRAHDGRLWVESRASEGSAFSFTLPIYGAAAQVVTPLVLIAAGDEWTRREVRRVAEEQGFATREVADGVEAVEAAMRLMPAVVVIDRVLPRLAADQVAERLREHPATQRLPLVALADARDLGDRSTFFRACIPKPLDGRALAAALVGLPRAARS